RDGLADVGIQARKFRGRAKGESKKVMEHEYLAVAVRTGSDTDGGDAEVARNLGRELARHGFEDYCEGTCRFHGARVDTHLLGGIGGLARDAIAAKGIQ